MVTIDEKLLNDYISGEYLKDEVVEALEKNKRFMEKVMFITKDKNLYNRCSSKIKSDTGFIRFLIKNFINDVDFLCDASDYYFENTQDEDNKIEIAIIMSLVTKKHDDDRYVKYSLMKNVLYSALRLQVEFVRQTNEDDEELQSEVGLGFYYVFDLYKNNKIVVDFYAKKMLKEIFLDDYYSLERILHEQYSSREEVINKGTYNCLLDAIRVYDDMLYSYLCVNKDLLSIVLPKLENVLKKWDKYVDINEMLKYDLIDERVYEYMEGRNLRGILSIGELLTYVGYNLGILEKLEQYYLIDQCDIEFLNNDKEYYEEVLKSNFDDRVNYKNVKKIITNILFEQIIEKQEVKKEQNNDGIILNMDDFRKSKIKKVGKN